MLKKVLAAAMAAVMALALAIPSFAAGGNTANSIELEDSKGSGTITQTMDVVADVVKTNLKIRFDKGAFVALNPYRMKYSSLDTLNILTQGDKHSSDNSSAVYGKSSDTIVSNPVKLQSLTRTAVKVNVTSAKATISGTASEKATISQNPIADVTKAAPKSMFLYVDFESSEYNASGVCTKLFQDYGKSNKFQLALTEDGASKDDIIRIPAYEGGSSEKGATWAECSAEAKLFGGTNRDNQIATPTLAKMGYSSDSTVIFRIGGQCVANPNNAPWAATDKPTVQIAFSFEPTYT